MEEEADAGMVILNILIERMLLIYKKVFTEIGLALVHIMVHQSRKSTVRYSNALYVEGLLYAAFYYFSSLDKTGVMKLLCLQIIFTFMIFKVKFIIGTAFIMGILTTFYPAYEVFLDTQRARYTTEMVVAYCLGFYMPRFSYIVYYLCNIAYSYLFETGRFTRSVEDLPLAGIYYGCLMCIYNNQYNISDICGIGLSLMMWMYLKSKRFRRRFSLMRPHRRTVYDME